MKPVQILRCATLFPIGASLGGCSLLPGGDVVDAALVTHTAGSREHTAAVKVPAEPAAAYAAMIRVNVPSA